jgi:spoIIIJ-associated protein
VAHAEASARTVEAAVTAAATQLGLRPDQVDVEVLEEAVPSTFGYIGSPARVRVTPRSEPAAPARGMTAGPGGILGQDPGSGEGPTRRTPRGAESAAGGAPPGAEGTAGRRPPGGGEGAAEGAPPGGTAPAGTAPVGVSPTGAVAAGTMPTSTVPADSPPGGAVTAPTGDAAAGAAHPEADAGRTPDAPSTGLSRSEGANSSSGTNFSKGTEGLTGVAPGPGPTAQEQPRPGLWSSETVPGSTAVDPTSAAAPESPGSPRPAITKAEDTTPVPPSQAGSPASVEPWGPAASGQGTVEQTGGSRRLDPATGQAAVPETAGAAAAGGDPGVEGAARAGESGAPTEGSQPVSSPSADEAGVPAPAAPSGGPPTPLAPQESSTGSTVTESSMSTATSSPTASTASALSDADLQPSAAVAAQAPAAAAMEPSRATRQPRRTHRDEPIDPEMVEADTERAGDFLEGLLDALDVDGDITTWIDEAGGHVDLEGSDLDVLVGSNGETLDALQELTRLAVLRQSKRRVRLLLDINGFRARQRQQLIAIVKATVERVVSTREDHEFQPMTPAERKIVHDAVAAMDGARTESLGEEPHRRVVIRPT